ncbi:MAG: chlorite dismutase [Chloroflexi bacterium]|nr:MAG: chlorite dismutase [Chloroflexota bacterium]
MSAPETLYANFWIYAVDRSWRQLEAPAKAAAQAQFACILEDAQAEGVRIRGVYSMTGLRHDADLILWVIADTVEAMQRLATAINASTLGGYLETRYTYLGAALGTRYTSDHAPAFVRGIPPKRYLSVYPFVKTHEWYQLPFEERRQAMAEHGRLGRDYPEILTNTVSSFGIGDHEFVVAFEADDVAEMVRMVEHLRPAASRPYTKLDTPIFLGVRKDVRDALADLG